MSFLFLLDLRSMVWLYVPWALRQFKLLRVSQTRRYQKDGALLPPSGLAVSYQMIPSPISAVGEGSSSVPNVPSYRTEWRSSPTLQLRQRFQRPRVTGNQCGSSPSVHLALWAAGPLRKLWNRLASPQSFCSHLNQTPSITPALGSPAGPPTTPLVQGGTLLWKGPRDTEPEAVLGKPASSNIHCNYCCSKTSSLLFWKKKINKIKLTHNSSGTVESIVYFEVVWENRKWFAFGIRRPGFEIQL